jgi:phosphonatase-like hydrolase
MPDDPLPGLGRLPEVGRAMSVPVDVDLVVFDLSGTTIADGGEIESSFASALATCGVALDRERFRSVRGKSKREALSEILPPGDPRLESAYAVFLETLRGHYLTSGARLLPGVEDCFSFLRERSVLLALNTGLDAAIVDVLLERLVSRELFAAVVCGDEVPRGRPAPYLVFRAMERAGVESVHRVMTVGDTERDLEAGFHAGARYNVGVLTGAHDRSRLERAPHTHILPSVGDLTRLWSS